MGRPEDLESDMASLSEIGSRRSNLIKRKTMNALFVTMYRSKESVQEFGRANIVAQNMPLEHILLNLRQNVELSIR